MKVIGIIPARYASSRFPGKPLADILGKSVIQRVYEQCKKASTLSELIVATDDKRIFNHVISFGGKALMTESTHLSGTNRCNEVIQSLETKYDIAINIQGDEPCINPGAIDQLIQSINTFHRLEFIQAVSPIKDPVSVMDITVVKVAISESGQAIYYSRSPIPYPRNQKEDVYYRCLGLYLYGRDFLKSYAGLVVTRLEQIEQIEQLRVLENNIRIDTVLVDDDGLSIDTVEDLAFVRALSPTCFK